MKKYIFILIFGFIIACSANKGVYWCGDHPCINKKEKELYFRKTMIVEVKDYDKKKIENDTEIQKLLDQAKVDEKNRKFTEKELKKKSKIEKKEILKRNKLEEKKRIKEEKELAKQIKIDEKKRIKEEKELAKKIKIDEKKSPEIVKVEKKKLDQNEIIKIESPTENVEIPNPGMNP